VIRQEIERKRSIVRRKNTSTLRRKNLPNGITISATREKLSMAKGKPQQTGMTADINSILTYSI
jgi:hypothetical protein